MLKYILKAMRPRQWTKNAFIFAALVFDRKLLDLNALTQTALAFLFFSLLASSVYLINDIIDRESDLNHPVKKNRPIASGKLPVKIALAAGIFLLLVALAGAFLISRGFLVICLVYFVLNIFYSKWLKHIPLIDVLVIAIAERGRDERLTVQNKAACFFQLAVLVNDNPQAHRKVLSGYSIALIDQLITIVSATTIIAYSLYTFSAPNLPENHAMMLTIPFVLYGIFRYLYLINVHDAGGEPEEILLRDRPIQVTVLLWGLAVMIIFYIF